MKRNRPQAARRRIDTPTLRDLNVQRLFGSQRALKSVEDFTEFEQLGAYFDSDHWKTPSNSSTSCWNSSSRSRKRKI